MPSTTPDLRIVTNAGVSSCTIAAGASNAGSLYCSALTTSDAAEDTDTGRADAAGATRSDRSPFGQSESNAGRPFGCSDTTGGTAPTSSRGMILATGPPIIRRAVRALLTSPTSTSARNGTGGNGTAGDGAF